MNAWERQPHEQKAPWKAFQEYLRLGPARTVAQVGTMLKISKGMAYIWSSRHKWLDRARAYDDHIASIERKTEEDVLAANAASWAKRQQEERETQWEIGKALEQRAREMLAHPITEQTTDGGQTVIKPVRWTATDIARIFALATQMKSQATGLHGPQQQVTGPDSGPVNVTVNPVQFYIPLPKTEQECIAPDTALTAEEREARDTAITELANRSAQ